jgi:hypothetical protein
MSRQVYWFGLRPMTVFDDGVFNRERFSAAVCSRNSLIARSSGQSVTQYDNDDNG